MVTDFSCSSVSVGSSINIGMTQRSWSPLKFEKFRFLKDILERIHGFGEFSCDFMTVIKLLMDMKMESRQLMTIIKRCGTSESLKILRPDWHIYCDIYNKTLDKRLRNLI